jgi:hypothetical protein|eukprot:COSAG01_NODE_4429_length_5032_cov_5.648490_5_plen_72_part_00
MCFPSLQAADEHVPHVSASLGGSSRCIRPGSESHILHSQSRYVRCVLESTSHALCERVPPPEAGRGSVCDR